MNERLNALIDEYSETSRFPRSDIEYVARLTEDPDAFEWIMLAVDSGWPLSVEDLWAHYRNRT